MAKEEERKKTKECPDWQDPQLLEDIKVTETPCISHIFHQNIVPC
jgi:hypothetical protein